ncbi:type IV pilus twitching motility protein PilT [Verrucomicrobiota bacterium sgz303538]
MSKQQLDALISSMVQAADGVSDLLFVVNRPPQIEVFGKLRSVPVDPRYAMLTPTMTEQIAVTIMNGNERLYNDFSNSGSCDTSYALGDTARFRVNIFKQNGYHAIVMRKLNTQIPTVDQLKLPTVLKQAIKEKNGLIFVTGATGNGKTTTLAAMLHELNSTEDVHVVTLEDPIEYLHPHVRSTFSQRELGKDFSDFATGLRAALRQAPKVILVGEVRDRETMEIALTASETGHLVLATLHTISASASLKRILGFFSQDEEEQLRHRLAETVRWIVSQRLVPKKGGGRFCATEIMGSNLRSREAILLGESDVRDFNDIISASEPMGWHTFERSLINAFRDGRIAEETAMTYSVNKPEMRKSLDLAKKEMFPVDDEPTGLRLNLEALHVDPNSTFRPMQ